MALEVKTQEQKYINPTIPTIIGGVLVGGIVNSAVKGVGNVISTSVGQKIPQIGNNLSADEFSRIESALADAIQTTGLKAKGVGILKASAENAQDIKNLLNNDFRKASLLKFLPESVSKNLAENLASQVIKGENSLYTIISKKIILPEKGTNILSLHELGHAINANFGVVGKILRKCRPMAMLVAPVTLIGLWKTKKEEGEKPKNTVDMVTTFVKENAGKLVFASFIPTILEEGLATIRGNKVAKNILSPELAKKVAKANACGFFTYLMMAVSSGLGIYLGIKIKDEIAHKKLKIKSDNAN